MVIELKRGELPEVVLNNLYKMTQLQDTFHMNMVALVDGQPRVLNLKDLIEAFISHRREVVTRRTVFELRKARERGHILEGLAVALSNVDEVIALIKKAPTPAEAKRGLMDRAWGSELVAQPDRQGPRWRSSARGPGRDVRPQGRRLPPVGRAGAGDPRAAPAAPDRPRAGQDPRRVQGGDRRRSPTCSTSSPSRRASRRSSATSCARMKTRVRRQAAGARSSPSPRTSRSRT